MCNVENSSTVAVRSMILSLSCLTHRRCWTRSKHKLSHIPTSYRLLTSTDADPDIKLKKLTGILTSEHLDAYIVPTGDPHLGEYSASRYERRQYISGFTGSAGTAVVLQTGQALLWTDGRYFQQAEMELSDHWQLMKSGEKDVPTMTEYLSSLPPGSTVAMDASLHSAQVEEVLELKQGLDSRGVHWKGVRTNLIDQIWGNQQPLLPSAPVRVHPPIYAGQSVAEKIALIRQHIRQECDFEEQQEFTLVLTELDEIAWVFNIRGDDVPCNPVTYAFALITADDVKLFIEAEKLTPEVYKHLQASATVSVSVHPYTDFNAHLGMLSDHFADDMTVCMDSRSVNYHIYSSIPDASRRDVCSPIPLMKACKNTHEAEGMRQCHRRDAAAVVSFLTWLQDKLGSPVLEELESEPESERAKRTNSNTEQEAVIRRESVATTTTVKNAGVSEVEIDLHLTQFRGLYSPDTFIGRSFDTIAGVNGNGAVIHYRAQADTCQHFTRHDLLLLDSGGQYQDGTTDVTRTVHLGTATRRQVEVYTRVLMGHIDLASAIFPAGTSGLALDALARRPLWSIGLDFPHGKVSVNRIDGELRQGTGHGVGAALCVHEGPQRIANKALSSSATSASQSLMKGMIVSIEPGYYEPGEFGVRLENLYILTEVEREPSSPSDSSAFLQFKPLTYIPFQRSLIDTDQLSTQQLRWLNVYHAEVAVEVSPLLQQAVERQWLQDACMYIQHDMQGKQEHAEQLPS